MTNEQIDKFLRPEYFDRSRVQISFKTRQAIVGVFIKMNDYTDLRSKNLWRIVAESKIEDYFRTKDNGLAKIFNGTEMTRLVVVPENNS